MKYSIFFVLVLFVAPVVGQEYGRDGTIRMNMNDPQQRQYLEQYQKIRMQDYMERSYLDSQVKQLQDRLKQTDDEASREKTLEILKSVLEKDYDQKMQRYEEHLKRLEDQLADMRAQLERRRQAKDQMVDLRIQTIEAEANNLGWPTGEFAPSSSSGMGSSNGGGGYGGSGGYGMRGMKSGTRGAPGSAGGLGGGMLSRSGGGMSSGASYGRGGSGSSESGFSAAGQSDYSEKTLPIDSIQQAEDMQLARTVMVGVHNYLDASKELPFQSEFDDQPGWQVKLLQYMNEQKLYKQFALDEAWDSEANQKLADGRPKALGGDRPVSLCWIQSDAKSFADLTDGASNTIALLVVPQDQLPESKTWTAPGGISPEQALGIFRKNKGGRGIVAAFYDGHVSVMKDDVSDSNFKAMLTIDGGEIVDTSHLSR